MTNRRIRTAAVRLQLSWPATKHTRSAGRRVFLAAFALSCALPPSLHAQVCPAGSEFQLNTYATSFQTYPAVAADPSGNFVAVWHSQGQDGDGHGVFGQRFASDGSALGTEFQVNSYTTNRQEYAAVAADPSGDFLVV